MKIGDTLVTAEGGETTVKWIGRQTCFPRFQPAERLRPVRIAAGALGLAVSIHRGVRAMADLLSGPIPFEGRVEERFASLYWNRLAFLEEKYYLRLGRGPGHLIN